MTTREKEPIRRTGERGRRSDPAGSNRSVILDQAAGRPGWAVALAILVAGDPDAVLAGKGCDGAG